MTSTRSSKTRPFARSALPHFGVPGSPRPPDGRWSTCRSRPTFAAGGLDPWGYHAWNLSIHILCGLLLFGIVRRTLTRGYAPGPERGRGGGHARPDRSPDTRAAAWTAFACALLWLVHPLQTEVIDYVTQRTESMMALAYFATLYLALRGMTAGAARGRWYAAAVASCALGMMCKESMVTAPVMVLLFDAVFVAGSLRAALRARTWSVCGAGGHLDVLAALVVSGPRSNSAGFSSGVDAWTYFLNQGPLVLQYLRRAVLPPCLLSSTTACRVQSRCRRRCRP